MRLSRLLPLLALLFPIESRAQTFSATAPSGITVEVKPGSLVLHQRSVRYEVYVAVPDDLGPGTPTENRLATITAVADGEIDDQTHRIEVIVDALTGSGLRRVTAFSDDGARGEVAAAYFVTTQTGCCSPLTRHHVRNLETGKLLFTATGAGAAGLVAVMQVPNHRPTIERWAAFEGQPGAGDPTLLGILRYGDRRGAIDSLALHMPAAKQPEEFALALPDCGALLWLEPGRAPASGQPQRPAAGKCFEPPGLSYTTGLFSLEHRPDPLSGFTLEMSLYGKVYATIPVSHDRLDVEHAKLEPGLSLVSAHEMPQPGDGR